MDIEAGESGYKKTFADKPDWVDWLARRRLGLPQSKTSRNFSGWLAITATVLSKTA
jgi:hypothetical protein